MKNTAILVLVFLLLSAGFAPSASAQGNNSKASKQAERLAKEAEKIHKKVVKLGIGDAASIKVTFFDDTTYAGHISETNDKSFTVVEKNGPSRSINYSDVKAIEGKNSSTGVKVATYVIVGVGAALVTLLIVILHTQFSSDY